MSLDRRQLLATAGATALTAAASKPTIGAAATAPGDAALNHYFDRASEHILQTSPEVAIPLLSSQRIRNGLANDEAPQFLFSQLAQAC